MEFSKLETLVELSSSKAPVSRVIKAITDNLASWKALIDSLSGLSASVGGRGGDDKEKDSLLIEVIKILGRVSSEDAVTVLEEDEIVTGAAGGSDGGGGGPGEEDEVSREELVRVLRTVCHAEFFSVVTRNVATWIMMIQPMQAKRLKGEDCKQRNEEILTCLQNLCRLLMEILPFTAKDACANLVLTALGILNGAMVEQPLVLKGFQDIQASIVAVNQEFEKANEKRPNYGFSEEQERQMHEREPPSDFRTIQIVPTIKELMTDKRPFLRTNKGKGGYTDAEHYLDVQFRLLREDFVQPLRKGVEDFLEFRDEYIRTNGRRKRRDVNQNSSVRLYTGVTFREKVVSDIDKSASYLLTCDEVQVVDYMYLFNLPENLVRKVNWDKSKRLLPGSLVLLTSDFCHTASFATVLAPHIDRKKEQDNKERGRGDPRRQELVRGILRVSSEAGEEFIQLDKSYIMLECEAFFEAYRYNLNILQKMNLAEFPLQKFLVNPDTSVAAAPSYFFERTRPGGDAAGDPVVEDLKIKLPFLTGAAADAGTSAKDQINNPRTKHTIASLMAIRRHVQCQVPVRDTESWPSLEIQQKIGLDDNQYKAYRAALTSEVCIIQGPPGTGKTFIGLKIVETMLLNKAKAHLYLRRGEAACPNSPILVVCYTNHALDQFLELLNHQKNLTMVRVGGQCKTPTLMDCTLPEHRKRLREESYNRHGGKSLLAREMRNQQYNVRQAMHNLRNNESKLQRLHFEIGIISSFSSVIQFANLDSNVLDDLATQVPPALLEMLRCRCTSFLGLKDDEFCRVEFSPTSMLRRFFKLKVQRMEQNGTSLPAQTEYRRGQTQTFQNQKLSHSGDLHFETEELEQDLEGEEYDLDELVEQRVVDLYHEDYGEFNHVDDEDRKNHQSRLCLPYFKDWSLEYLPSRVIDLSNEGRKLEHIFRAHRDECHKGRKGKRTMRTCEECINHRRQKEGVLQEGRRNENKLKFIFAVFDRYKEGLLELPDISHFLQKREKQVKDGYKSDGEISSDDDDTWIQADIMKMEERWSLYFYTVNLAKEMLLKRVTVVEADIDRASHQLNLERQMVDGLILKQAEIVGMTTTGASKYHDLLEIAKPEIVIIEEAAEILEAHTVTSLTKHCKHLILIGDHLQLRPSTNVYHLARKFHLDLSLFERMINNDMNLWSLKTQHRMRPEIADLIVGPIYTELHNHSSVLQYPDVRGVAKNVFLISHSELEETDTELLSKSNTHEADFLTAFCYYLTKQGYGPDKITILTTYTGQMFLLKKKLKHECGRVRITCIDNYQGEENDIILLSLVRSNKEDKIGFVGIDNRICVALSRAKHGLFIMGNDKSLTARSTTWKQILEKLNGQGNCGESLSLMCQRHRNVTEVKRGKDFNPLELGGCILSCDFKLGCGHLCILKCHGFDQQHQEYKCKQKCEKLCPKELHPCGVECYRECPPCVAKVINELKCGHQKEMRCWEDPAKGACQVVVTRTLPKCGHEELLPCYMDYTKYICRKKVRKVLECDHIKEMECHIDEKQVQCKEMVEKELIPCGHSQFVHCCQKPDEASCGTEINFVFPDCHHELKLLCGKIKTAKCEEKCEASLKCGHKCGLVCHVNDDPNHETYKCKNMRCRRQCPEEHECQIKHPCYQPCPPCPVTMPKTLPCNHTVVLACHNDGKNFKCQYEVDRELGCSHIAKMRCWEDGSNFKCLYKVDRELDCGHTATMKCSVDRSKFKCYQNVDHELDCGHSAKKRCCKPFDPSNFKCQEMVDRELDCGHIANMICWEPFDRINFKCQEMVDRELDCGHIAKMKCWEPVDQGDFKCPEMVDRELDCGHIAKRKCSEPFDSSKFKCHQKVDRELDCGHSRSMKCSKPFLGSNFKCQEMVDQELDCGHIAKRECWEPFVGGNFKCREMVYRELDCGHIAKMKCWEPVDGGNFRCQEMVDRELDCGHIAKMKCWEPVDRGDFKCPEMVDRELDCGHIAKMKCWEPVDRADFKCPEMVDRELDCGHIAKRKCSEPFDSSKFKCHQKVDRELDCGHSRSMKCSKPFLGSNFKCQEMVDQELDCGHIAKRECWEPFVGGNFKCREMVYRELDCGHIAKMKCWEPVDGGNFRCQEMVDRELDCGHIAKMKCWEPVDGGNFRCQEMVDRELDCGHIAKMKCWEPDDGGNFRCQYKVSRELDCGHSRSMKCSDPVTRTKCQEMKLMKCGKCHHERHIMCSFAGITGCIKKGCGQKYPPTAPIKYESIKLPSTVVNDNEEP